MPKVFMFNRTRNYESKTITVITDSQEEALKFITRRTLTAAEEWDLIAESDAAKEGIVGELRDDLGV